MSFSLARIAVWCFPRISQTQGRPWTMNATNKQFSLTRAALRANILLSANICLVSIACFVGIQLDFQGKLCVQETNHQPLIV